MFLKKTVVLSLSALISLSVVGCSSNDSSPASTPVASVTSSPAEDSKAVLLKAISQTFEGMYNGVDPKNRDAILQALADGDIKKVEELGEIPTTQGEYSDEEYLVTLKSLYSFYTDAPTAEYVVSVTVDESKLENVSEDSAIVPIYSLIFTSEDGEVLGDVVREDMIAYLGVDEVLFTKVDGEWKAHISIVF